MWYCVVKALPNNRVVELSKMKVFVDDKVTGSQELKLCCGSVQNIRGRKENDGLSFFFGTIIVL